MSFWNFIFPGDDEESNFHRNDGYNYYVDDGANNFSDFGNNQYGADDGYNEDQRGGVGYNNEHVDRDYDGLDDNRPSLEEDYDQGVDLYKTNKVYYIYKVLYVL